MKRLRHAVGWFQIPVLDLKRAQSFYEYILEIKFLEPEEQYYLHFPIEHGTIGGALVQTNKSSVSDDSKTMVYLNANPNLNMVLERVKKMGGKIIQDKRKINTECGYIAIIEDSEGNKIGLHSMG